MLTSYSILQCRWWCHILSEISDRGRDEARFDTRSLVAWPGTGFLDGVCRAGRWLKNQLCPPRTTILFFASIVGSKLTGTATVRAHLVPSNRIWSLSLIYCGSAYPCLYPNTLNGLLSPPLSTLLNDTPADNSHKHYWPGRAKEAW